MFVLVFYLNLHYAQTVVVYLEINPVNFIFYVLKTAQN